MALIDMGINAQLQYDNHPVAHIDPKIDDNVKAQVPTCLLRCKANQTDDTEYFST